jgi:hypothetical protein
VGMGRCKLHHGTCSDVTKIAGTCISAERGVLLEARQHEIYVRIGMDLPGSSAHFRVFKISGIGYITVDFHNRNLQEGIRDRDITQVSREGAPCRFEYGVVDRDFFGERAGEYLRHANKCVMNRAHNLAVY